MIRNSVLLSVGAALVLSLFMFDVSHAVQIDRAKQFPPTRMVGITDVVANAPATQVASTAIPCRGDGMRRTGAPCTKQSARGADVTITTLYTLLGVAALAILTLTFLLLSVSLSHRIQEPPLVKSTH